MLMRAIPAVVVALVITFSQDHSALFGFYTFGPFALATGIIIGFEAVGLAGHPTRGVTFTRSIFSALVGGAALIFATAFSEQVTPASFIYFVAGWAFITGLLELLSAWIARNLKYFAREASFTGALTLLLGLLLVLLPPDLLQPYGGLENIEGALTASVQAVGYVGAYLAILAVMLIIEGFTLRAALKRDSEAEAGDSAE